MLIASFPRLTYELHARSVCVSHSVTRFEMQLVNRRALPAFTSESMFGARPTKSQL